MAVTVKNRPAMQETQVPSLGQEDPLEKQMATHSSILAWEIPRTEEARGYSPRVAKTLGHGGEARTRGKPNCLSPSEPSVL